MNKELIDRAWACLPREFKEKVKREYARCVKIDADDNPHLPTYAVKSAISRRALLEKLFGEHNLTSNAEGEETLICEKSKVQRAYNTSREIVKAENPDSLMHSIHTQIMCVLESVFGSECLPDAHEDNFTRTEPKPAEPKFNLGDKAILKGYVCTITSIVYEQGKFVGYKIESPLLHGIATVPESDLEPYTEPVGTKDDTKGNTKDPTFTDDCKSQCKSPDRLRIAAMAMQAIISRSNEYNPQAKAMTALEYADALIAECEKGGQDA